MKKYIFILTYTARGFFSLAKNRFPALLFAVLLSGLYAGSSTTYTTDIQFSAGVLNNTIVFGSGDNAYVSLFNNFNNVTGPVRPSVRRWPAASYDSSKDKIVLFGGLYGTDPLNDTWVYDPQTNLWSQKSPPTVPPARYGHILVPAGANKAVLFGGSGVYGYLNDTWEYNFDTDDWTQVVTVSSPPALVFSCADYNSDYNKIILFGGTDGIANSSSTWIYHVGGSSWTRAAYGPSSRNSGSACYDPVNKRFLVFGGDGGGYLSDTWAYNYSANSWSNRNPASTPTARKWAQMVYDAKNAAAVLFGGKDSAGNKNDVWFYGYASNKWSNSQPSQTPSSRYGYALNYMSSLQKMFLFGGIDDSGLQNDYYNYAFYSSGTYTTIQFDSPFSTRLYWQTAETPIRSGIPSNTSVKFQIASSVDNGVYSDFTGWDDTSNTYFEYANNPIEIGSIHNDRRYLKLKFIFDSSEPPLSGSLQSVAVRFNRSPVIPPLLSPTNNFSTDDTTPGFAWYAVTDDDGDSVSYKIEIAADAGFASPIVTSSNIASTVYSTTTVFSHGTYFWRVRAWDGNNYSDWASPFTLYVDTIPPSAVTSFSASVGSYNGTINLLWSAPGNAGSSGNIISGKYYVRYSTYPVITEADWQNSSAGEKTIQKSTIIPGENQTYTVDALANAATYYFSVKTADGTGNISAISSTSAFCMTNAAPDVVVKSPNGSEGFSDSRIISWTSSDPYPLNDVRTFSIYDSSDGINFVILASNLPDGTTYYLWNTKNVRNSAYHRIKIIAADSRGLEGFDISDNDFTVNNPNVEPVVSLTAPLGVEKITKNYTVSFSVSDGNLSDTHRFTVLASTNSGLSYDIIIAENITAAFYNWDTTQFPNSPRYRIKILATDDGSPYLTGADSSDMDFEVNNNNKTPSVPVLISPLNDSYNTIGSMKFIWQKSTDPNPEDLVTYTVYYSTDKNFIGSNVAGGLIDTEYTPSNISEDVKYYWKVSAADPFGYSAVSDPFSFTASWSKDDSDDGNVRVEITDLLPSGYYVKVEDITADDGTDFSAALRNSISDRLIKCINQKEYKITLFDNNNVPRNISAKGRVRFNYSDGNNDGYIDGTDVKINNIRVAYLNEIKNRWEFPRTSQVIDKNKKQIRVDVEHFSYFTTVASVIPNKKVSNLVNFPNPFNPEKEITTVKYVLTESDDVSIRIFNLVGDPVYERKITGGAEGAIGGAEGYTNEITWDGQNENGIVVSNGVYIMEVKSGKEKDVRKIAVIK